MFIAREKELAQLRESFGSAKKQAILNREYEQMGTVDH